MSSLRSGAVAGCTGVLLNVIAVAALGPVPHTYSPADVGAWLAESKAAPTNTIVSAWAFTVGLVLLAAFGAVLARRLNHALATVGAVIFGAGLLLDAAGTLLPIAALKVDDGIGLALLWATLLLDSANNGLLGVALICFSLALPADWPKAHRWLGLVAGVTSLPVGLQFASADFARLLAIAGPLWLTWILWASVRLWRSPDAA
jgi:hypothetical protein